MCRCLLPLPVGNGIVDFCPCTEYSVVIVCTVEEDREAHGKISSGTRPSSRTMFLPTVLTINMEILAISLLWCLTLCLHFANCVCCAEGEGASSWPPLQSAQTRPEMLHCHCAVSVCARKLCTLTQSDCRAAGHQPP